MLLFFVFCILFVRNDQKWVSFLTSFGSVGTLFPVYFGLRMLIPDSIENQIIVFLFYILGFVITGIFAFIQLAKLLKEQSLSKQVSIRILDIILGYGKMLQEYVSARRKELDKEQGFAEQANLFGAEIKAQYDHYEKLKSLVDSRLSENDICINIKRDGRYPITARFLNDLPEFISKWSGFVGDFRSFTNDFINSVETAGRTEIDAYFIALCSKMNQYLFSNNPQKSRSHVRILNGKLYKKAVSAIGINVNKKALTDIPDDNGMIYNANKEKSSLIKSYNHSMHYEKPSDHLWIDYITIPLYEIEYEDKPYISVGISIQSGANHEDMLIFLRYIKIEVFIIEQVRKVVENFDIKSIYN